MLRQLWQHIVQSWRLSRNLKFQKYVIPHFSQLLLLLFYSLKHLILPSVMCIFYWSVNLTCRDNSSFFYLYFIGY